LRRARLSRRCAGNTESTNRFEVVTPLFGWHAPGDRYRRLHFRLYGGLRNSRVPDMADLTMRLVNGIVVPVPDRLRTQYADRYDQRDSKQTYNSSFRHAESNDVYAMSDSYPMASVTMGVRSVTGSIKFSLVWCLRRMRTKPMKKLVGR
jgi:hypothetical protein